MTKQTFVLRALLLTIGIVSVVVGLRELTTAPFQLLGDYVLRVNTKEQIVAVTFDDGPHPRHTPVVLDILDRHQVKATFFFMGRNVQRYPDVAREVVRRGHEVGNHSYSHPKLLFMSPARVRDEIERTDELIRGLGVAGPIHFRPPHGAKFIVLPYVLNEMGKLSVGTDVNPDEWRRRPAAVMTESIMQQVKPGSIIGLHDVLGVETIKTLENVLTRLETQGYRFETVSQLIRRRQ